MKFTNLPIHIVRLVLLSLLALAFDLQAQWSGSDDFNDASSDANWLPDINVGHGYFTRANRRPEYLMDSPDLVNGDEAYHPCSV